MIKVFYEFSFQYDFIEFKLTVTGKLLYIHKQEKKNLQGIKRLLKVNREFLTFGQDAQA